MILRRILLKLRRRSRLERDMETELTFHRELAREHANPIGLGNSVRIQEDARDLWRFSLIEDFCRDVQYAVRSLRRTPGFALIAILTIALGIGANTAIFTLLHRVMLAPLPVREPEQLVELLTDRGSPTPAVSFSYHALRDLRSQTQVCSSIIASSNVTFHTLIEGKPIERSTAQFVTGDYFPTLGVSTVVGRPILPEDDRTGAGNPVAVISYAMWQNRFGGGADALGKSVLLENVPFTIIGVAPPGFRGLEVGRQNDIWVPVESERRIRRPSYTSSASFKWLQLVGRLKPGATIEQAKTELQVFFKKSISENEIAELIRDGRDDPESIDQMKKWSLMLEPARTGFSRTRLEYSKPLLVLMSIVGVLLLIACTNVANLLLARALEREKEIALRLSLGARRARLIRQLLTESGVLVAGGTTLGLLLAYLISNSLAAFLAVSSGLVLDVSPNPATLGFTAAMAIFTVVLFGLMPAFRSTDMDFATRLKGQDAGWGKSKGLRWSRGLIVVQVALLMVLILGAGLFLRSLHNLNSIALGFDRSNVLLVTVDPFGSGHSPEQLKTISTDLLERIQALPGVRTASLARFPPITGGAGVNLDIVINRDGSDPTIARDVWVNYVGAKYFATMKVPVIAGREFTLQDSAATQNLVIVNQTFAQRYFGTASPLGRTIIQRGTPMEIIGLVGSAKYGELRGEMEPTVYFDVFRRWGAPMQFFIRSERRPETVVESIRGEIRSAIVNVLIRERTVEDQIDAAIVRERLVTRLAALFGSLALVLAVIGLYGVVTNSVARRTREIGIRIALGLEQRRAVAMVLREVLALVGGGILLGLPLAVAVTRSISSLLYGLTPADPATILVSVTVLLLSTFAAGFIPASRASRVDPMVALRNE
jgi:predicted permease